MIKRSEVRSAQERAAKMLAEAGIVITPAERENIEIVELGLGELETTGLEIVTYVNTELYCAKELVMFPGQTCPEHRHPPVAGGPGKMETFRCRTGIVRLYVDGETKGDPSKIKATVPAAPEGCFTVLNEIELAPGEQYTIDPDTLHWFQAGEDGAVVSEFSSTSRDDSDVFSDARIKRATEIEED